MGQLYYAKAAKLIEELDALEAEVRSDAASLTGTLRLTAPATFGEMYMQPLLMAFAQEHPGLTFDLHLSDRFLDLAEEGYDLAIRLGTLSETNMIARRLSTSHMWCVAYPEYLALHGAPEQDHDLKAHRCIRDSNARYVGNWPFIVEGQAVRVAVDGPFMVNSAQAVRNLAVAGQGVGLCPDFVVARDVRDGHLVRVLSQVPSVALDIHAVFLENRHLPQRVRTFLEFVLAQFKARPGWDDWVIWSG